MQNKPELLAPAGNLEKLKIAVLYGADAVFLGLQKYGLRSSSDNFTIEEVEQGVNFAKQYGVKVYVTTNIFPHENDYDKFKENLIELDKIGVTGIIVSDPGYIAIAKQYTNLEIHISTQQSINNSHAVNFYENLGADRVVLGRELNKKEIQEIKKKTNIEIEVFIHGAVCSSYSGRCTLSNHMTLRDSNRGGCCQSCRWNYDLVYEENEKIIAIEDEIKFNMSTKDMNLLPNIQEVLELGVDSLKIEGRMKSLHYLATVVKNYRQAIDEYYENQENEKKEFYQVDSRLLNDLKKAESRESSLGAFANILNEDGQIYGNQYQQKKYDYCGYILEYDSQEKEALVEQRNFFKVGDIIEIIGPNQKTFQQKIKYIKDENGEFIEKANHPLMKVRIKIDQQISKHNILRKEN